ncbi:hypothetical protein GCM10027426_11370 [Microbacterium lacusdiani]
MVADTRRAVAAGAHGIVIGGTRDGRVDPEIVRPVLDAAGDVPVSFHRAFDTLADHAAGRIQVMAGGGIDPSNLAEIVATGVDGIHASAKGIVSDAVAVSLGTGAPAGEGGYETTDEATAMRLREILRGA